MGATSVTGVGPGAADGNKGPGNGREQFVPLLTPHVVAAGTATLPGVISIVTVTFPNVLAASETEYAVIVTGEGTNNTFISAKTDDANSLFASFEITGNATQDVGWMVVSNGTP